jgi:C4-dicarboxylate-specific signal transduction histidine kinase
MRSSAKCSACCVPRQPEGRVFVEDDLERDLPSVVGDRIQLQQLLLNLLLNGLEATDPVFDRPKKLFIRSRRQSPEDVLVEIRDYGAGLEDPDKVFEAFFTTKENGMGMGWRFAVRSSKRITAACGPHPGKDPAQHSASLFP